LPIKAPEPVLHRKALTRLEGGEIRLQTVTIILRVDPIRPTVAQLLLQASSREAQPGGVDKCHQPIGASDPEQHSGGVGHSMEPLLAATQRLLPLALQALLFRLVTNHADGADQMPGVVMERRSTHIEVCLAPIWCAHLEIYRVRPCEHLAPQHACYRPILRR